MTLESGALRPGQIEGADIEAQEEQARRLKEGVPPYEYDEPLSRYYERGSGGERAADPLIQIEEEAQDQTAGPVDDSGKIVPGSGSLADIAQKYDRARE